MPVLTPGQIVDALARTDPTSLIGAVETEQVDFKLGPYVLAEKHQKWELAKDVAAFANRRGGLIVIGIETQRLVNEIVEAALAIRPVRKTVVDLQQHRSVVDSWIYPRPVGIDIRWYPPETSEDSGLLVIEIPAQCEESMPFMVREMTDPQGSFRGAVGIPRRDGERIVWDSPSDIHRQITMAGVNTDIESSGAGAILERSQARIQEIEAAQGWGDKPTYFIQALPPRGLELEGFYSDLRRSLTQHQILREDGFAPWRYLTVTTLNGGWFAHRTDVATLVESDGLLTHGLLVAADTLLGWYFNEGRSEDEPMILHPIAFVETTLEFFRFFYSQIWPRADGRPWQFKVSCRRYKSNRVVLPAGHPQQRSSFASAEATGDEWGPTFNQAGTPGRDAFEALQRLYILFGYSATVIPLAHENSISEESLLGLPAF